MKYISQVGFVVIIVITHVPRMAVGAQQALPPATADGYVTRIELPTSFRETLHKFCIRVVID